MNNNSNTIIIIGHHQLICVCVLLIKFRQIVEWHIFYCCLKHYYFFIVWLQYRIEGNNRILCDCIIENQIKLICACVGIDHVPSFFICLAEFFRMKLLSSSSSSDVIDEWKQNKKKEKRKKTSSSKCFSPYNTVLFAEKTDDNNLIMLIFLSFSRIKSIWFRLWHNREI